MKRSTRSLSKWGRRVNPAIWTHRLRSLVLSRPDGEPDCLVLIINDETARYDAEERFEATFAANPAPAIILPVGGSEIHQGE